MSVIAHTASGPDAVIPGRTSTHLMLYVLPASKRIVASFEQFASSALTANESSVKLVRGTVQVFQPTAEEVARIRPATRLSTRIMLESVDRGVQTPLHLFLSAHMWCALNVSGPSRPVMPDMTI